MHRTTVSIFVTLWSLVLLPGLCVGGVIGHACECLAEANKQTEAPCHHSALNDSGPNDTDCHHQADCHHESDCADDPCTQLAAATRQRSESSTPAAIHLLLNMGDGYLNTGIAASVPENHVHRLRPESSPLVGDRLRLPFAPSDTPLLV